MLYMIEIKSSKDIYIKKIILLIPPKFSNYYSAIAYKYLAEIFYVVTSIYKYI